MKIRSLLLIACGCLSCTGCAAVGGALLEGLFDATCDAIFDSDDDCDVDPHILKRKGIKPGSRKHRKLCAEEKMQQDFYKRNNL